MREGAPPPPADGTQSGQIGRFESRRAPKDHRIARIAADQEGLITLGQLQELGIGKDAASRRVASGRLHRVHEGVFAVRLPLLSLNGRFLAAVLACGKGAVLSHRSAAVLWGLLDAPGVSIDVTAPNRRGRHPIGIRAHRDHCLHLVDRTEQRGIPCTTVARTLLDLAGSTSLPKMRRLIAEAEVLRILDQDAVRALIKRSRGRRGVARLRLLLEEIDPDTKDTRSELERRFLRLCVKSGLPKPEVNALLDLGDRQVRPDFLWRHARLIVETDGLQFHGTGSARNRDSRREQHLQLAAWRVSHCTWAQLDHEPMELAARIRGLLELPPTGLKADK